jgi:hypothetical protein
MALPFEDNSFDVYTISFGIRNVTRIPDALSEAFRVLKPGGRLMVLEFSQLPNDGLQRLYDLYSFNVIPRMGQVIAGDRDSYQYLVESIRKFPDQETFAGMIRDRRVRAVAYRNLSFGSRRCIRAGRSEVKGPHNIWRLVRTGATLRADGRDGRGAGGDGRAAGGARRGPRAGLAVQVAGPAGDPAMPPVPRALTALGPAYIKFGQILSTRPDVVGDRLALELQVLAGQAAAVSHGMSPARGRGTRWKNRSTRCSPSFRSRSPRPPSRRCTRRGWRGTGATWRSRSCAPASNGRFARISTPST